MKKLLAILLAASMLFAFAACGGNTEDTTTTTAPAVEDTTDAVEDTTAAPVADDTTAAPVADDTTAAVEDTTAAAEETTLAEGETAAPAADMTKAEFVAFINAETAKAAKGSYNYNRTCEYTDPIDVGSATDTLNNLIGSLSDGKEDINSVVGGFLGIGTKKGSVPKDDLKSNYKLKATALTEADLGNFTANNGVYTFTLANATNPQKNNKTPIARFTNDFITHQEVVEGVDEAAGGVIKVNETNVNYTNIKVTVTVANGKITNIKYSYAFDAALVLKAIITINGSGAAVTKAEFSNIKY
ncbi:MAG: hypothetical protein IJZ07_03175 [Clostridia bacterium]|nr:hypothetical protein [Clostridia bacterium]